MTSPSMLNTVIRPAFLDTFSLEPHANFDFSEWSVLLRRSGWAAPLLLSVELDTQGGILTITQVGHPYARAYSLPRSTGSAALSMVMQQAVVDWTEASPPSPPMHIG
jgi:hypothetical protein